MKKLLLLLSLLLVVGCSVEQDTAYKPEVEVVKESTYLMCGNPLDLSNLSNYKVYLVLIRNQKVFRDGVLYEGMSYGPDPDTHIYFSIGTYQKHTSDNGRISMDYGWGGDKIHPYEDAYHSASYYEITHSWTKDGIYGMEKQYKSKTYELNRETLELLTRGPRQGEQAIATCEISSMEANEDFWNNFSAEEKHIEEKENERRKKEKAEQLKKNKI